MRDWYSCFEVKNCNCRIYSREEWRLLSGFCEEEMEGCSRTGEHGEGCNYDWRVVTYVMLLAVVLCMWPGVAVAGVVTYVMLLAVVLCMWQGVAVARVVTYVMLLAVVLCMWQGVAVTGVAVAGVAVAGVASAGVVVAGEAEEQE